MSDLKEAVELLKAGEIVIFPTETSYGMGARITDAEAARKIYEAKKRPLEKPLSVIASSLKQIELFAEIGGDARQLSEVFHPGPLTLVVKAKKSVPEIVSRETLAFRIPAHPVALSLCKRVGEPITATSANKGGEEAIYDPERAKREFPGLFVLDRGKLERKPPSTVFDVETKEVLREGPVKKEEILKALER